MGQEPSKGRSRGGRVSKSTQRGQATADKKRVNVNFSGQAYDALTELAEDTGESMSDVIRDAIALKRWYEKTRKEGGRILVERDGQIRELVPF